MHSPLVVVQDAQFVGHAPIALQADVVQCAHIRLGVGDQLFDMNVGEGGLVVAADIDHAPGVAHSLAHRLVMFQGGVQMRLRNGRACAVGGNVYIND
jgi:hypothetical protein